jgi:hypothetical protein
MRPSLILLTLALFTTTMPRSTAATAAAPLVVLVRPSPSSSDRDEALVRLRAELSSAGFDIAVVDSEADADPRETIEQTLRERGPAATIGIFGGELWIADRLTGKTVVRTLDASDTGGRRAPEVLAIRAAELLRASLSELLFAPSNASPPPPAATKPPAAVTNWVSTALEPGERAFRVGFEAGAAVLGSLEGVPPAVTPLVRARMALGKGWLVRATAAGLGTRPEVSSGTDTASIRQDLLLAEIQARLSANKPLRPLASIGVGAYRFGLEGRATWPDSGLDGWRFNPAADVGLGFAVRLHPHLEISLETHAIFVHPQPAVRFFEETVAHAGRPTLFGSLTLAGWL